MYLNSTLVSLDYCVTGHDFGVEVLEVQYYLLLHYYCYLKNIRQYYVD
jgi:hypothetical protein